MQPWREEFIGRFEEQSITSTALEGNPLGDPATRHLWIYLPPGYAGESTRRYPTIYIIQGLTGQVDAWWNRSAFRPTVPQLIDRLFASDDVPPAVVVMVDAFTALAGISTTCAMRLSPLSTSVMPRSPLPNTELSQASRAAVMEP